MSPRPTRRRRVLTATAALLTALALAPGAHAVTFDVSAENDAPDATPGDGECRTGPGSPATRCGLRAAIEEANALAGSDVLRLNTGTFEPASALPVIAGSVAISGNGSRATVLEGGGHGPALRVSSGAVVIRGLTITGGAAAGADGGGGLLNTGAIVTLDEVALRANRASAPLGGARGGAVANHGGSMTIVRSLVTGNLAEPGGLGADGDGLGGGIYSNAPLTIVSSTIHANTARGTLGASGIGGGIAAAGSVTLLRHVTLSDNAAQTGPGGNLWSAVSSGVELRDSILTGGSALAGAENCGGGALLTSGRNLDSGTTCALAGGDISATDPLLERLSAQGGSTDARAPLSSSPAVAAASECALDRDQRGSVLPVAGACDLGAVDHSTDLLAEIGASRIPVPAGGEVTLTLVARNIGLDTVGAASAHVALPPRATVVRTSSPVGSCSGPPPQGARVISCPLGPARLGDAPAAQVTVRAPSSGAMTFTSAVSSAAPSESSPSNDSTTLTIPISAKLPKPPPEGKRLKACEVTRRGDRRANRMTGTEGSDRLLGKAGADRIDGRGGADCLAGQEGSDVLIGGGGRDDVSGGPGADRVSARDGARDTIRCGPGRDLVTADKSDRVARDCERVLRR